MLSVKDIASFNDDQELEVNHQALRKMGGLKALESKLNTNFKKGLSSDKKNLEQRRAEYGANMFPEPPCQTWMDMFIESFEDTTLIVLIVAAVVSLIVGMYEDPSKGWIEGAAILFAVLIVAVVTACNNYNKEKQFRKLNAVKDDVEVGVIRDGKTSSLDVKQLVVGDIVLLNAGDRVPADGVVIDGSDISCNESSLTGEPDDLKKCTIDADATGDIFLLSGTTVSTGYVHMLCCAVGEQSRWGKTKAKLAAETEPTPLQEKLDVLANQIGNFGIVTAVATFFAMIGIWYLRPESRDPGSTFFEFLIKAFIMGVTIVVVAVPEGLPLAVTLSLAYSTQKMMHDNNLIRVLAACETMGNATNICSDKTGTLTQNRMTVVEGWVAGKRHTTTPSNSDLPVSVVDCIAEGVALNSTANLMPIAADGSSGGLPVVAGSKTEGALLMMLKDQFGVDYVPLRANFDSARGDRLITFSSARKRMSVVLKNSGKGGVAYTKGAAEILLERASHYVNASGKEVPLDAATRGNIAEAIAGMAKNALRAVALAHKHLKKITPDMEADDFDQGLVMDAVYGIKDPLRPDVPDSVRRCQEAGIFVRMVTGDNIETAKAIAKECGILTEGGIAMEGPAFRKLSPAQLDAILPTLQVLARSSPDDKHILVSRLNGHALPEDREAWESLHAGCVWDKERDLLLPGYQEEWQQSRAKSGGVGEVVGVTGDGTNDGPALKAADVGLSMGLSGTDVAKEASDIVILDDNFSSIVKSVMWGRSVFDNIRKFLQFQLTVNAVALTLTFLAALFGKEPPLNAVMMLWVNLIMDTMGALALGTEPPSTTLLERRPYKRNASLINTKMIRHISFQFIFQMAVLYYLSSDAGASHFNVVEGTVLHGTVIFNTFVFCQVFNEINARSIGDEMNVFHGLFSNVMFIAIIIFTVVAQYFIVEYGGDFVRVVPLDNEQWIKCILLGALSLPVGGLMRILPVRESKSDFAVLSDLIKNNQKKMPKTEKKAGSHSSVFSLSGLVWLAVVTVLPVVTYQHFEEHWAAPLQQILSAVGVK